MSRPDHSHPELVKGPYGRSIVGGVTYPSNWIPAGKVYIQVLCILCEDSGVVKDDNDEPSEVCDCVFGDAVRDSQGRAS